MPKVTLKKEKTPDITVVKNMRDYSNDPVYVKKAEKATNFLKKNGLLKSFKKSH